TPPISTLFPYTTLFRSYAGIVLSLARQEWPDLSAYTDAEIVTRVKKSHHAGLIVRSTDPQRVEALIGDYTPRFYRDFFATVPPRSEEHTSELQSRFDLV